MYTRQEVEVRPGVLEWVDHVMWYIRAGACLAVDPSSLQKEKKKVSALQAGTTDVGNRART